MEGEPDFRHWDELTPDALGLIFINLELQELFQVIPLVCKSWCKVVEGPYCWRRVDLSEYGLYESQEKIDRMLRTLIMRSSGSLCELKVMYEDQAGKMLSFIAEHAGSLKKLSITNSSLIDSEVEEAAPKLSLLSHLDLRMTDLSTQALETLLRNCKSLVSFDWERDPLPWRNGSISPRDEALIIARSMPKLKRLSIAHLDIDTPVALEVLSGCRELEWLDIRGCSKVELDKKFWEEKYPKIQIIGPLDPSSERWSWSEWFDEEGFELENDYDGYETYESEDYSSERGSWSGYDSEELVFE